MKPKDLAGAAADARREPARAERVPPRHCPRATQDRSKLLFPLDWRWRRATELAAAESVGVAPRPDPVVLRAVRFLRAERRRRRSQRGGKRRHYDDVRRALRVRASGERRVVLEAWLLTGLPDVDVARRTRLPVTTVRAYHQLFFDLPPRRHRDAVLGGVLRTLQLDPDDKSVSRTGLALRRVAFFAGPVALECLIPAFRARRCERLLQRDRLLTQTEQVLTHEELFLMTESLVEEDLSLRQWFDLKHRYDEYLRAKADRERLESLLTGGVAGRLGPEALRELGLTGA